MIEEKINRQIKPGATVRVWEKIPVKGESSPETNKARKTGGKESNKERLMKFEGLVLSRKHGNETGASFTVRATLLGVGVEKVYPIHSPFIDKVEIINTPKKVHRAKLYYIRNLSRRETRQKLDASASSEKTVPM